MSTVPDMTPRAMRIDGPLSARAVLDHFNDKGRALLGAGQEDAAVRIAQLLAHEADLSAAWGGLPGTDPPRPWQPAGGGARARRAPPPGRPACRGGGPGRGWCGTESRTASRCRWPPRGRRWPG